MTREEYSELMTKLADEETREVAANELLIRGKEIFDNIEGIKNEATALKKELETTKDNYLKLFVSQAGEIGEIPKERTQQDEIEEFEKKVFGNKEGDKK